jgi:hypothetical protein
MIFEQCDSESSHIQYTVGPPVNNAGDFNRLKIEAVFWTSILESKTEASQKKAGKLLRAQLVF